jgi:hypothetical protein
MMPTPLIVWALRAAHSPRSGDEPATHAPKDRSSPIRPVWNAGDKPARQSTASHLIHTKER